MDRSTVVFVAVMAVVLCGSVGVILTIGSLLEFEEESYTITYELDGGINSPDNPGTYKYGDKIEFCDPTKEGYLFDGWYIMKGGSSERIFRIDPLMTGDITVYASWSINLVGRTLNYDVVGSIYDKEFMLKTILYQMSGTYSLSYLSYDSEKGYQASYTYEYTYTDANGIPSVESDTVVYWTDEEESTGEWSYLGEDTLENNDSSVTCKVYRYQEYEGMRLVEVQDQWIFEDWLPYRIDMLHFLGYNFTVERYQEVRYDLRDVTSDLEGKTFEVEAYGDEGISVTGSGTYDAFKPVTLEATVSDGVEFVGWFSEGGRLLSTSTKYTIVAISGDQKVFAANSVKRDVELDTGASGTYSRTFNVTDPEWVLVNDDSGDVVDTQTGTQFTYDFDDAGIYTLRCLGTVDGEIVGNYLTIFVDGPVDRTFNWKDNSGISHTYTLSILYSDYLGYAEDDIVRNQMGETHDLMFVTYKDEYIKKIAEDFNTKYSTKSVEERIDIVLTMTQNIQYMYDSDTKGQEEYWKYPLETLFEQNGDCEDTSFLFCAIVKAMGHDTAIFIFDGHMAAGVSYDRLVEVGDWYDIRGGKNYFYCETTATGYTIGHAPSGLVHFYTYVVK